MDVDGIFVIQSLHYFYGIFTLHNQTVDGGIMFFHRCFAVVTVPFPTAVTRSFYLFLGKLQY